MLDLGLGVRLGLGLGLMFGKASTYELFWRKFVQSSTNDSQRPSTVPSIHVSLAVEVFFGWEFRWYISGIFPIKAKEKNSNTQNKKIYINASDGSVRGLIGGNRCWGGSRARTSSVGVET